MARRVQLKIKRKTLLRLSGRASLPKQKKSIVPRNRRGGYRVTPMMRKFVQVMTMEGWTQEKMCQFFGISMPTLHKHFRRELDFGAQGSLLHAAHGVFEMATMRMPTLHKHYQAVMDPLRRGKYM